VIPQLKDYLANFLHQAARLQDKPSPTVDPQSISLWTAE